MPGRMPSLPRWITALFLLFVLLAAPLPAEETATNSPAPELTLDQQIDEGFGKVTGDFVNGVFLPCQSAATMSSAWCSGWPPRGSC